MSDTKYFDLNLTATTKKLYDFLKMTCLTHGSYLNPVKVGPFVHGWTDNTYNINGHDVPSIDESMPIIDTSYDAIRWSVQETEWIKYDPRIGIPQLQYIEIVNLNPFGQNGITYDQPMSWWDWKGYFLQDEPNVYNVSPNGRLFIAPEKNGDTSQISVLIADDGRNNGIYAGFNIAFLLPVDGVNYCCIVDPVINVRPKDN